MPDLAEVGEPPSQTSPVHVIKQDRAPMRQHRRLAVFRRLLHDETLHDEPLPLRTRTAASLVLLHAQPISRIIPLTTEDVIDAWCAVHWTFRWRDGPFDAVGTAEGRIKGVYTGANWGFVDGYQLAQETDPDDMHRHYTVEADLSSVTDLEQRRTGLPAVRQ